MSGSSRSVAWCWGRKGGHRAPAGTRLPSPAEPSRGANEGPCSLGCTIRFSAQRLHDHLQTETPTGRRDPLLEGAGPGQGMRATGHEGRWDSGPADVEFRASLKTTQETDNTLTYKITCSLVPFGSGRKPPLYLVSNSERQGPAILTPTINPLTKQKPHRCGLASGRKAEILQGTAGCAAGRRSSRVSRGAVQAASGPGPTSPRPGPRQRCRCPEASLKAAARVSVEASPGNQGWW